jgi:hypothetical protein
VTTDLVCSIYSLGGVKALGSGYNRGLGRSKDPGTQKCRKILTYSAAIDEGGRSSAWREEIWARTEAREGLFTSQSGKFKVESW